MARFNVEVCGLNPARMDKLGCCVTSVTRPLDSRRVEHKVAVGLVRDFPTESAAWAEVEKQHLQTQSTNRTSGAA